MSGSATIQTDQFSSTLRSKAIDTDARRLLITNLRGTGQESDLSVPPNCGGFGRVRHFRRATDPGWPPNPLPIDPAVRSLGLERTDVLRAQAFQNAACNWRCWYCFVPFELLAAKSKYSSWLSAGDLLDLYQAEADRPVVIDLTGGQPDLTPEWIPWMMEELVKRGLQDDIFLWSDDNLSNDYYFRFLTEPQRELVANFDKYARVCCFKGFSAESFSFNTRAAPDLFDRQFDVFRRLLAEGIDLYAYATFTTPKAAFIAEDMARFVDRLQGISENLPLRTVLLKIVVYSTVTGRVGAVQEDALVHQERALEAWLRELQRRYTTNILEQAIADITQVAL